MLVTEHIYYLESILDTIFLCTRQSIALRCHNELYDFPNDNKGHFLGINLGQKLLLNVNLLENEIIFINFIQITKILCWIYW